MDSPITTATTSTAEPVTEPAPVEPTSDLVIEAELLIEEISIDGMCGVY